MSNSENFRAKFYDVVDIFRQWMPEGYNFSSATILDFGCEHGIMSLGFALRLKAKRVIGVDINSLHSQLLGMAREFAWVEELPSNLEFYQINVAEKLADKFKFDVIFAWSTFEHVCQTHLDAVVKDLRNSLNDNGLMFIQIAPLYYSPYGSHLESLNIEPWEHLKRQNDLFHNDVLATKKQLSQYENETDDNFKKIKTSIWSCYETLNKLTADETIELFENNGFILVKKYLSKTNLEPSQKLCKIYLSEILQTEQIVALFQKSNHI
jgi:SAM-dependent methyltransferase